jgi:hypothetical protein
LDDPLRPDRLRKRRGGLVIEALPRLLRVRMDLVDLHVRKLCAARAADQDF